MADAYKPLLECLESNDYEGIKTALKELSPNFAAEQDELEKYRQYESLIDHLEKETFDAAEADFYARIPAPAEPTYSTIEITADNWETYFKIITVEDWQTNGFGEAETYFLHYQFKLRDEYLSDINTNSVNLSVELTYTANYHHSVIG